MARSNLTVFRWRDRGEELLICSYSLERGGCLAALTPAELAVAEATLEDLTPRQIAASRGVSERTVENQLSQIYRKLGVVSRYEMIALVARETAESG
jgi:DNA-binding CsgD family transcriptional regulator